MGNSWETTFQSWVQPPGKTEQQRCENAENAIRNAIKSSEKLRDRDIRVFAHGSYRNRVNVRRDGDVDIGVCCYDVFFPWYPEGTTKETFGISDGDYQFAVFKDEVEQALTAYFGSSSVDRGNKAFDLRENSYRVEADVAPFFEHRRYHTDGHYLSGVELRPDNAPYNGVINWPEQHYDNGVQKNTATHRRYKAIVRVLKSLCIQMDESGVNQARNTLGFLIECLVWNVPNSQFGHSTYTADVRASLAYLYNNTMNDDDCREWGEVSELKYLFRGSPWTRAQAHLFIGAAWNFIGFG